MPETATIVDRSDGGLSADARILSLIYEHTSDAVCLIHVEADEVYRVVLANESFFRMSGFERGQVMGAPLERFIPESVFASLRSDIRSAVASRHTVTYERSGTLPAGPRYGETTYVPVFETDRPVTHILFVMTDITPRKLAELERERLLRDATFLSDATRLLGTLDIEQALADVAHLAVSYLAEACAIDLFGDGAPRRLATASGDAGGPLLGSVHPTVLGGSPLTYQVGAASHLSVPLRIGGRVVAAITFASTRRRYGAAEFEIVEELARRAALAMDNATLYRQAKEALRMRDEFLSLAAHEIRGPLTSIHLTVQSLLQRRLPPERMEPALQVIEREDRRLSRFVEQLLDLAAIRTGRLRFELEEVDLVEVVAQAARRLASELERAGSSLIVNAPARVVGHWDRARLEQVVVNLLSNAIKFGLGKPIEITLAAQGGRARLAVRDHGIGIDPGAHESIFEPFERRVSARHYGGLGLGLHVVRTIVAALGGKVTVESEVGVGATFVVELPERYGAWSADADPHR